MTKLWYTLKRNNIQIPFPIRTVYFQKTRESALDALKNAEIIKRIELFQDIPEEDILQIAHKSKIKHFTKGERIIIQGEESNSLYMLISGEVNITSNDVPIRELKQGEYFGEMSLLTGEKRSATVIAQNEVTILEIGSDSILPIIKENPNLMENMSKKLAERKIATKDIVEKALLAETAAGKETLSKNIFYKIEEFFYGKG